MWILQEAQALGDEFLSLEKYVNLNYLVSCILSFCLVNNLFKLPHAMFCLGGLYAVEFHVCHLIVNAYLTNNHTHSQPILAVLIVLCQSWAHQHLSCQMYAASQLTRRHLLAITNPGMIQGFHKILKKHDKLLPHAPCRQFYITHLHQQPWVQVVAFPTYAIKMFVQASSLNNQTTYVCNVAHQAWKSMSTLLARTAQLICQFTTPETCL